MTAKGHGVCVGHGGRVLAKLFGVLHHGHFSGSQSRVAVIPRHGSEFVFRKGLQGLSAVSKQAVRGADGPRGREGNQLITTQVRGSLDGIEHGFEALEGLGIERHGLRLGGDITA
jgi:hypothetical protein